MSLLKVVATIESPASHQGTARPEAKNSEVLCGPPAAPKNSAGTKQTSSVAATMTQSSGVEDHGATLYPKAGLEDDLHHPLLLRW